MIRICYLCNQALGQSVVKVWVPDQLVDVHEACAEFFEASRPPVDERRERWLQQKASVEDSDEVGSSS